MPGEKRRAAGRRLPADLPPSPPLPPVRRPCPSFFPSGIFPLYCPPYCPTRRSERKFSDDNICKYFLCGFCPHEEFRRTKNDCGDCPSVHDDACKAQWDALDDRAKERYGWAGCGWAGGLAAAAATGVASECVLPCAFWRSSSMSSSSILLVTATAMPCC